MDNQEIRDIINSNPELAALAANRDDAGIAAHPSFSNVTQTTECFVTARGVRGLPVTPRSRHALLETLKAAETSTPAWLIPALTAATVPVEDHAAFAADLSSAWSALTSYAIGGGLDVGSSAARSMLDIIAVAVPETAEACTAVKAMANSPAPITLSQISQALNEV